MRRSPFAVGVMLCACALWSCGPVSNVPTEPTPQPVTLDSLSCPDPAPGKNTRVTSAIGESNSPVIGFDGEHFTVAWWDMRGRFPSVHAARLDRDGMKRSPSQMLPHKGAARFQTVAADSMETHLVWLDEGDVRSTRGTGDEQEPVTVAAGDLADPAAGPYGSVAWVDKGRLLFLCDGMGEKGSKEAVQPLTIYKGGIEDPRIAWTGEMFAVVWSSSVKGGRKIMLQRVSNQGKRVGKPVNVSATSGVSRNPEIVWTGEDFAVAWTNAAPAKENPRDRYRIFFAVVPPVGTMPKLTRQLDFSGTADRVALACAGKELGLSWVGSKEPMGSAVYFHRLGLDGKVRGERVKVSDDAPLTCGRPSITWAGNGYGVTWHDDREQAGSEVFFSFLSCGEGSEPPSDAGPPEADGGVDEKPEEGENPEKDTPNLKSVF